MPIMNTTIFGGGTTPTGTITITSNGITDVTNYANADVQVPTTAPALYREFQLDGTGKLVPNTTTTHIMNFTGMTDVSDYALGRAYSDNTAISGAVDMSDLTTIGGINACAYMFYKCTGLTGADLSSLTTVNSSGACQYMFQNCTGLISMNLSSLTTISGSNACYYMFFGCTGLTGADLSSLTTVSGSSGGAYMFFGCTGLTSANLSSLTTISGSSGCAGMFNGCTNLISVNLSSLTTLSGTSSSQSSMSGMFADCTSLPSIDLSGLTTITGGQACSLMFANCTSLATVYIGGTTAIDFGTRTNQFNNMFNGCTQNIDVYAPAASQAKIESFSGYPNFGASGNVVWHWRS